MTAEDLRSVSAVVCTWNSIASIEDCVKSLFSNQVQEVIVVDAGSSDGTLEVLQKYPIKILKDQGQGLARARNLGIENSRGDYVLNFGSDNVLLPNTVPQLITQMKTKQWQGISCQTHLYKPNNYWSKAMDAYKKARFFPGERAVIGTPTLFASDLLKKNPYSPDMTWSDDADLCSRLAVQGYKFGISDLVVYEKGTETLKSIIYRWRGYGKSDFEIFSKNKVHWTFLRRLQSLFYPFKNEFLLPVIRIHFPKNIFCAPFLFLITTTRYYSWLKHSFKL